MADRIHSRRLRIAMALTTGAALVTACNAILGNETGGYAPSSSSDGGNTDDALLPDGGLADGGFLLDAAGCEDKNLLSDPKHCGACGHDCLGGACEQAQCQPVTLFTGKVWRFAVHGDRVWFTSPDVTAVRSVPTIPDGTGVRVDHLGASNEQPRRIAVTSTAIVWRDQTGNKVWRKSRSAAETDPAELVRNMKFDLSSSDRAIIASNDEVFFVDAPDRAILRIATDGGLTTYATMTDEGFEVAATSDRVFWNVNVPADDAGPAKDVIASCPRAECTDGGVLTRKLPQSLDSVRALETRDGVIYASGFKFLQGSGIVAAPVGGGAFERILNVTLVNGLSADATHLYFPSDFAVAGRAERSVYRVQIDGAAPTTIAELLTNLDQVYVDDKAIYWATRGNQNNSGALTKLAK